MLRPAAVGATALLLAACVHAPPKPGPAPVPVPTPPPAASAPSPGLAGPVRVLPLSDLPGWAEEDHAAALAALQIGCGADSSMGGGALCQALRAHGPLPREAARAVLEALLRAEPIEQPGLLTGYFAPSYEARRTPEREFSMPVLPRPADLTAAPYAERAVIEARPATGALAWMRPEELFFLQIQGSGVLRFPDGTRLKASVAATNNQPFVAIARPMREQGLLAADNTSGEAIRAWLAAHRGAQADAIMRLNGRYVFFALSPDDGAEPRGAANIPLPPGRAVAIDPAFHAYGAGLWLDADAPILAGAFPRYRRLVVALDTGGAIRGEARADLYIGSGEAAGVEAGRIRHDLRLYRLASAP